MKGHCFCYYFKQQQSFILPTLITSLFSYGMYLGRTIHLDIVLLFVLRMIKSSGTILRVDCCIYFIVVHFIIITHFHNGVFHNTKLQYCDDLFKTAEFWAGCLR